MVDEIDSIQPITFLMQKFRTHKGNIISSKRDSQKIEQLELLNFSKQHSLTHSNNALLTNLSQQLHSITQHHYKITQFPSHPTPTKQPHIQLTTSSIDRKRPCFELPPIESPEEKVAGEVQERANVPEKTPQQQATRNENDTLSKILELMSTINMLQQKKSSQLSPECQLISSEIKQKLSEFKELLTSIQSKSQNQILDFYNEEQDSGNSPNSFNSRSSDEAYQENTEREAYELTDREKNTDEIQIKYRRVQANNSNEDDDSDTFLEDIEDLNYPSEQDQHNQSISNESSIIHLFSYEKEKCAESPLSSITERESEYFSPDSKNQTSQSILSGKNLEYKKIQYLLETSEKKKDSKDVSTTSRLQVSEFSVDNNKSNASNHKILPSEARDRSRCHSHLMNMINLLETKYNRTVKPGCQNLMDALNATLSSRHIRPRQKK